MKNSRIFIFVLSSFVCLSGCAKNEIQAIEQKYEEEQKEVLEINNSGVISEDDKKEINETRENIDNDKEEILAEAKKEAQEIIILAKESADKNKTEILENAKAEAQEIIDEAEKEAKKKIEEVEEENNDDKKPEACFEVDGNKYKDNIYYKGSISLDASCSDNTKIYQWYLNGVVIGEGEIFNGFLSMMQKIDVDHEIKLVVTSDDGFIDSTSRIIRFKTVPEPVICFNQDPANVKTFKLNEEYSFDASCSTFSEENPITKYTWKFRDGGIDNPIIKEGIKVNHSFSSHATTFTASECDGPNDGLEVELDIETKIGNNYSNIYHYCIEN